MKLLSALIFFLGLTLAVLQGADAQQIRPFSGCGVVIVRPLDPEHPKGMTPIPFYRDPGVARLAELPMDKIPGLSSIMGSPAGEHPIAVMGKKGSWLRIAYDDAGREGWVEKSRWWDYITWGDFLKGRTARLFPGLTKKAYILRDGPGEMAPPASALSGRESLKIIAVDEDWALVIADTGLHGWLPWRDGDGRFLIVVEQNPGTQKH